MNQRPLRPLGLGQALLYFGIPAAVFSASLLGLLPWMVRHGVSHFVTFNVTFGVPLALMLLAAIIAYRLEGRPWSMPAFRERMQAWLIPMLCLVFILLHRPSRLSRRHARLLKKLYN